MSATPRAIRWPLCVERLAKGRSLAALADMACRHSGWFAPVRYTPKALPVLVPTARRRHVPSSPTTIAPTTVSDALLDALKMILVGAPLNEALANLTRWIESHRDGMLCSISLLDKDGIHLRYAAAASLPQPLIEATDGMRIGPDAGSCGSAAYSREPVFAADVEFDPRWLKFRDAALSAGLRAAWSSPIFAQDGRVLGTLAMYCRDARYPDPTDVRLMEHASLVAGIAIEHQQAEAALREAFDDLQKSEAQLRQILDSIPQTVAVLGPDGTILYANRMVLDYCGLSAEEALLADFRPLIFHPEDLEALRDTRRRGFAGELPWENEIRVRTKEGPYRWFLIRYNPLYDDRGRLLRWCAAGTDIDDRKRGEERLRKETLALRDEIDHSAMYEEIVGSSVPLRKVIALVGKVAPTDSTVLILGETGTGKELIARAIHKRSNRAARAFICVNCAVIPPSLVASELFGHEKGAFTGAVQRRVGRFEAADGGTIFLDEIGELLPETQKALLRVLQERQIERVGGGRPMSVDVRVLAATNRDLEAAVAAGTFRQDLFYRLNVFPLRMPPLRERKDDIPLLLEYIVERYAKRAGKKVNQVTKKTLELFRQYDWPGNVRELQNVIERSVILGDDGEPFSVDETWLQRKPGQHDRRVALRSGILADDEKEFAGRERQAIEAALAECRGRVSGPNGAAAKLGIPRQTLDSKIESLGIVKQRFKTPALPRDPS
jgi:formate hydrogenlyase transcriptional activator